MPVMPIGSLLSPPRCVSCLQRGQHPWCPSCLEQVRWLDEGACSLCASPRPEHDCWPSWVPVSGTTALAVYEGPVADAVVTGKVRGAVAVWRTFGRLLGALVDASNSDVVVPIPTDRQRARQRGHDHALLLARAVAAGARRPMRQLLSPMGALPDRGRAHAGASLPMPAFRARADLAAARVLLVDDVLTTGTTAAAAACSALDAGAARVAVAVVGRAGSRIDLGPMGTGGFGRGHSLSRDSAVR